MIAQGIVSREDVLALEAQGVPEDLPVSTYEMICRGAAIDPSAPALSFFMTADVYRNAECWTYGELVRDITRTANAFTRLGVTSQSVIAYVLPNLPETHFVIWGGQAAGITCAINPLLEGEALADLLNAAGAEVLVTLAPFPQTDIWQKVHAILDRLPALKHLVLVNLADRMPGPMRSAARMLARSEVSRLHGEVGLCAAVPAEIVQFDSGGDRRNRIARFHEGDGTRIRYGPARQPALPAGRSIVVFQYGRDDRAPKDRDAPAWK